LPNRAIKSSSSLLIRRDFATVRIFCNINPAANTQSTYIVASV
jgi:hypothetical protein